MILEKYGVRLVKCEKPILYTDDIDKESYKCPYCGKSFILHDLKDEVGITQVKNEFDFYICNECKNKFYYSRKAIIDNYCEENDLKDTEYIRAHAGSSEGKSSLPYYVIDERYMTETTNFNSYCNYCRFSKYDDKIGSLLCDTELWGEKIHCTLSEEEREIFTRFKKKYSTDKVTASEYWPLFWKNQEGVAFEESKSKIKYVVTYLNGDVEEYDDTPDDELDYDRGVIRIERVRK